MGIGEMKFNHLENQKVRGKKGKSLRSEDSRFERRAQYTRKCHCSNHLSCREDLTVYYLLGILG